MPTVVEYINQHIDKKKITNAEIGRLCKFPNPNTVSMIRHGRAKLPIGRLELFAKAIGCNASELCRLAMNEYQPETLAVIEKLLLDPGREVAPNNSEISPEEKELLGVLKEHSITPIELKALIACTSAYCKALRQL